MTVFYKCSRGGQSGILIYLAVESRDVCGPGIFLKKIVNSS